MSIGACWFSSLALLLVLTGFQACWSGEAVLCRRFRRGGCPFKEPPPCCEDDDFQMVDGSRVRLVLEYWLPAVYLDLDQQPHYNPF